MTCDFDNSSEFWWSLGACQVGAGWWPIRYYYTYDDHDSPEHKKVPSVIQPCHSLAPLRFMVAQSGPVASLGLGCSFGIWWYLGIRQLHGIKPQTIPDLHELKLSTHSPDCIWDSSNISLVSPSSGPPFVAGKQSSCVPPCTEGPCVVRSEMIRTL